jgi:hypothetical protein
MFILLSDPASNKYAVRTVGKGGIISNNYTLLQLLVITGE